MTPSASALEFLSGLEQEEASRLSWGLIDGYFTEEEVDARAEYFVTTLRDSSVDPWQLVEELLDAKFLWRLPNSNRYRTRSAEAVRLFARLRQIFPDRANNAWRSAPSLVADYRYIVRPRLHPKRDISWPQFVERLRRAVPVTGLDAAIVRAFAREGERDFAGFQLRAAERVLRASRESRVTGTVVSAGTGAGKTVAFYLPAFSRIAEFISADSWTKCLAIYPRVELLKDQLGEAVANARRIRGALRDRGKRGLTIGALYGDVPNRPEDVAKKPHWPLVGIGQRRGYRCPFVRCPDCEGDMYWWDSDVAAGVERLQCGSHACSGILTSDEFLLTRQRMVVEPPDVLFTSTEMLNQQLASRRFARLFGIGQVAERRPRFMLLDEAHAYEGIHGAHVALLLRRWRRASDAKPHYVGLSATLADAPRFFAELVGLGPGDVAEVAPEAAEMQSHGSEYMLALRGNPASGASLPSTTIQSLMLLARILSAENDSPAGRRVFAFTDNLDGINRLFDDLLHAEGWERRRGRFAPTAQGSLANLRAATLPNAGERFDAGQNWKLVEDIGHVLAAGNRIVIGRTTSQDTGVDADATVVVATASLEVGFDDPEVGGVLQHKAPMSNAAFLQRKGRAGRRQTMRPWTIVVLSDFGRDRSAYQGYDLLFSSSLSPRQLPLANRSVLRMQATYALCEWLVRKLPSGESPDPWVDFSQPADELKSPHFAAEVRRRQGMYVGHLQALLDGEAARVEFASFLRSSLRISDDEVIALMWEPPRSILMDVVPTLLRRLERKWRKAGSPTHEAHVARLPLPEFIPGALFGDLRIPDVAIHVPGHHTAPERIEPMRIAQAMSEFAPGRVSRRFGVSARSERHWVAPSTDNDVSLDSFCPPDARRELGQFTYVSDDGALIQIPVYQPLAYRVSVVPPDVQQSSNSFLHWRTEIVSSGNGHVVQSSDKLSWSSTISSLEFHTHHLGVPLELRRFAVGAAASVGRGRQPRQDRDLRFVVSMNEQAVGAALGFAADVDGLLVRVKYPGPLYKLIARDERLLRGLRVARFHDLVSKSTALPEMVNRFQRGWLSQAFLTAVAADAMETGRDLRETAARLASGMASVSMTETIATILQWTGDDDSDSADNDSGAPKRLKELLSLLHDPHVMDALQAAAPSLWETPTATWEPWLRLKFKTTLGAAVVDAAERLCPDLGSDSLTVDIRAVTTAAATREVDGSEDQIWLNENTIGGGGLLEVFLEEYTRDPRRFFRLLDASLAAGELEAVGYDLARVLRLAAGPESDSTELASGLAAVRRATSHESSMHAMKQLRKMLIDCAIEPTQTLLISMLTRFLGPGTGTNTDVFFASVLRDIERSESRLGIDLDARVCAFVNRTNSGLERSLGVAPPGNRLEEHEAWRFGVIYGMLWPRGAQVRAESLYARNAFDQLPGCDRLLVTATVATPRPTVDLSAANWGEHLNTYLLSVGSCDLVAEVGERPALSRALLELIATPIDSGTLLLYPSVAGIARDGNRIIASIELPEAAQ